MCNHCLSFGSKQTLHIPRRSMLRLSVASAVGLALGNAVAAKEAEAPPKPQNVLSPDAALKRLMAGNARYVGGSSGRHDFKHEREALAGALERVCVHRAHETGLGAALAGEQ